MWIYLFNIDLPPKRYWRRPRSQEVGEKGGTICLMLHCLPALEWLYIEMDGSDDSHFNASLIVRGTITRPCPQTINFEEKGEPKRRIEPTLSACHPHCLATPAHRPESFATGCFLKYFFRTNAKNCHGENVLGTIMKEEKKNLFIFVVAVL